MWLFAVYLIIQQRTMHPFQVYARVRPLNDKQSDYFSGRKAVSILDSQTLAVGDQDYRETHFQLDAIFGQDSQNQEIFNEAVRPLADNFLKGINSTVLAYGITGAGKSFTMFGKSNDYYHKPGLIQLAIEYICDHLANEEDAQLTVSYMEIYNQQVFDLLRHNSQSLQILDDPVVGVIVNDLEQVPIYDTETALKCIADGNQRRVVAETRANQFSSRSHAIVQLNIEKKVGDSVIVAKLSLVDLAGSEKQSVYAENRGIRNFQGSNINKSLLTLGNCINILSAKKGFVPYRDSKLTRLLKDSLGGNTRTSMIACISPSHLALEETVNTMKYACRARKIEKNVHQNIREPRTVEEFKKEIAKLRRQMEVSKLQGAKVSVTRQEMQEMIQKLIKNVENVTIIRMHSSAQLHDKMKEIDLIDEQRAIINTILSKCEDDIKLEQRFSTIKHSESQKLVGGKPRYKENISMKQSEILQRISEEELDHLHDSLDKKKKGVSVPKNNFQVSKLENRRLRYRQIHRHLKGIVFSYHENYEIEIIRCQQIQRTQQFLEDKPILSVEQKRVLQKIRNGQRLQSLDLAVFHIQQSQQITKQQDLQQSSPQKPGNNRFMSSLQQIRRMMRKISNKSEPLAVINDPYGNHCSYPEMEIDPEADGLFNDY